MAKFRAGFKRELQEIHMSIDTLRPMIGGGFCLVMRLKNPSQLPELMSRILANQPRIRQALASLDYVHFARFVPIAEPGLLLIVTEYDGHMQDYVMDFAAVLDEEFQLILSHMKDAPQTLPSQCPDEFWNYVRRNVVPTAGPPVSQFPDPFSGYEGKSVIDINGFTKAKLPPPPRRKSLNIPKINYNELQVNLLKSYRPNKVVHLAIAFDSAKTGQTFIEELLSKYQGLICAARVDADLSKTAMTIGFTFAGLQALGVPEPLLAGFPQAFREGPAKRAPLLGDDGSESPAHWEFGGAKVPADVEVHALLSLYAQRDASPDSFSDLESGVAEIIRFTSARTLHRRSGQSLDDVGTIHFGYRDGIAQPGFAQASTAQPATPGPPALQYGDFILGESHNNSRGGNFMGRLPLALADHASYVAFRVMRQNVGAFEDLLARTSHEHQLPKELLAAKLMGRWADGSPITRFAQASANSPVDDFDYTDGNPNDLEGLRCPIGAHIRRINPRSGMVMGVPLGRMVLRRGMSWGAKGDEDCGLMGMFVCGDLETQYEFLLRVWARGDLAAPGLRGTHDPFIGHGGRSTPFRFRMNADGPQIELQVPPLVQTLGSLYLFVPGMGGLRWLACASAQAETAREAASPTTHEATGA